MQVDIYIKERNGSRQIRIPWLPDTIKMAEGDVTTAEYKIIDKGDVAVPTGTGLASYSWESVWPGQCRNDAGLQRGSWMDPKSYHNMLNDWKKKGTPLNLMVTGYPINLNVYVKKYDGEASGGFGDITYSLELEEQRDLVITSKKVTITYPPTRPAPTTTGYTIKRGDTLWGIARRYYGSGTSWQRIYDANSSIIESTAKSYGYSSSDNGHWIFPGVTIQIPR